MGSYRSRGEKTKTQGLPMLGTQPAGTVSGLCSFTGDGVNSEMVTSTSGGRHGVKQCGTQHRFDPESQSSLLRRVCSSMRLSVPRVRRWSLAVTARRAKKAQFLSLRRKEMGFFKKFFH